MTRVVTRAAGGRPAGGRPATADGMHPALAAVGLRFWPRVRVTVDPDLPHAAPGSAGDPCWVHVGLRRRPGGDPADPRAGQDGGATAAGAVVALVTLTSTVRRMAGPLADVGCAQRTVPAARAAWELTGAGPVEDVRLARRCDTPHCCRPSHHAAVTARRRDVGNARGSWDRPQRPEAATPGRRAERAYTEGVLAFLIGTEAAAAWWDQYRGGAATAAADAPPAAGRRFADSPSAHRLWALVAPLAAEAGTRRLESDPPAAPSVGSPLLHDPTLAGATVVVRAGDLHAALVAAGVAP